MRAIAVAVLVCFVPCVARAGEDVPLAKDEKAPHAGVLLTVDDYAQVIKNEATQEKLKSDLETEKKLADFQKQKYEELLNLEKLQKEAWQRQAEQNAKRSWWEENKFQVGVGVGAILTVVLVFGVAQAVQAR